jgi:hypothetical protein
MLDICLDVKHWTIYRFRHGGDGGKERGAYVHGCEARGSDLDGDGRQPGRDPGLVERVDGEVFVRIGVQIPTIGDLPGSIGVVEMGRLAEDAGADSLWVNDHVLMIEDVLGGRRSPHPFTEDGVPWWPVDMPWYECLTAASFLAATTRVCEVGTSVLVLPERNVLEWAKTTAALDALSGGRLVLGIGVG